MIYKLTLLNLQISPATYKYIDYHAKKTDRYLPNFSPDLALLEIVINRHDKKGFFDGSITLHLPKQALNAHFRSRSVDQGVKLGFQKIRRELKNYKGRHFVGNSEYPRREEAFKEQVFWK